MCLSAHAGAASRAHPRNDASCGEREDGRARWSLLRSGLPVELGEEAASTRAHRRRSAGSEMLEVPRDLTPQRAICEGEVRQRLHGKRSDDRAPIRQVTLEHRERCAALARCQRQSRDHLRQMPAKLLLRRATGEPEERANMRAQDLPVHGRCFLQGVGRPHSNDRVRMAQGGNELVRAARIPTNETHYLRYPADGPTVPARKKAGQSRHRWRSSRPVARAMMSSIPRSGGGWSTLCAANSAACGYAVRRMRSAAFTMS